MTMPLREPDSNTVLGEICHFTITLQNDNSRSQNRQVMLAFPKNWVRYNRTRVTFRQRYNGQYLILQW